MADNLQESPEKLSTNPYRGTRDFYPEDMRKRNAIFQAMRGTAESFGYEEYDGPMLEMFELYAAKSGEELVKEQLYHFMDRGGRHVAIRPEMTPTVARMVAARINELPMPIRWYSLPNLWRYEKPQRGRLREHWQFNVDILGADSVLADQEIIEIAIQIMRNIGAQPGQFQIHIANRRMLSYFLEHLMKLPQHLWVPTCKVIDKKSKIPPDVFEGMLQEVGLSQTDIQSLNDYMMLDWESLHKHPVFESDGARELELIFTGLEKAGYLDFCCMDLSIVRGLDYYTGTVFEMYDLAPQNRRAMFGGGRYDDLVGLFSKAKLPGVGFGMGDVTIMDFIQTHGLLPQLSPPVHIYVALFDEEYIDQALILSRRLREMGFRTITQLEPVKLSKQYKQANQRNIPVVVLQGPDEIRDNRMQMKYLPSGEQLLVSLDEAQNCLQKWLG